MAIKKQPIILLFILQIAYMLALSFAILVLNYIFNMTTSPLILFLFIGMFPAITYSHHDAMKRVGIVGIDAICLTKIMAWFQFSVFFIIIVISYSFMKLTILEAIIFTIVFIFVMFIVRFFGISMIKKIDDKNTVKNEN